MSEPNDVCGDDGIDGTTGELAGDNMLCVEHAGVKATDTMVV